MKQREPTKYEETSLYVVANNEIQSLSTLHWTVFHHKVGFILTYILLFILQYIAVVEKRLKVIDALWAVGRAAGRHAFRFYNLAFQISLSFSISGHTPMTFSPETGCVGSLGESQVTIYSARHTSYYGIWSSPHPLGTGYDNDIRIYEWQEWSAAYVAFSCPIVPLGVFLGI